MRLQSDNLGRKFHNRITPALSATGVAQIFNLRYRRIVFGRSLQQHEAGGLQIRDTAECNSALRASLPASLSEITGLARGLGAANPARAGERGMATFICIALLAIMLVLVTAESSALFHLHREMKLLEQKQIQRLGASPTNAVVTMINEAK